MSKMTSEIQIRWDAARQGAGSIEGSGFEAEVGIPVRFGGSGLGADSNSLLLSSAAASYVMTLMDMLAARKLFIDKMGMYCKGSPHKRAGIDIDHYVHFSLSGDPSEEAFAAARALILKANQDSPVAIVLRAAGCRVDVHGVVTSCNHGGAN